uniref:cytochrome c553 n=1 Tax=Gracilaria cliftonii TaxID=206548 RepID=UPI001D1075F5|nr:cytochrome c553 [Gracilaria cliftonii]UAD84496.1 cytochrome c553 [Gracilaria cliftonii]
MRLLFTFFIILNIFINNVQATFAADLDAGEQIFSANCAACHANGNNSIMPDKTLKSDALSGNDMNSIQAITNQVRNGKNAMPAFGGRLADEDIENVANYVLNKSENGW